jgi:hypothetical protein
VNTFSPLFTVVTLFSNYTLLACLMLILVDIQSSIALVDSLMVLIPSNDIDIASLIEAEDIEDTHLHWLLLIAKIRFYTNLTLSKPLRQGILSR